MRQVELDSIKPTVTDRFLSLFANVRPGEGLTALLLMLNVFTLLTAYYIIKPVREALIFAGTQLAASTRAFAAVNVFLVLVWLGIALVIVRYVKEGPSARIAA